MFCFPHPSCPAPYHSLQLWKTSALPQVRLSVQTPGKTPPDTIPKTDPATPDCTSYAGLLTGAFNPGNRDPRNTGEDSTHCLLNPYKPVNSKLHPPLGTIPQSPTLEEVFHFSRGQAESRNSRKHLFPWPP